MIHFYELKSDVGKYEKFGKMTDHGEILLGKNRLLSIYPKERWKEADPKQILALFNNGHIIASHEELPESDSNSPHN